MIVATAGSALARPAAAFLRTDSTRLLSPGDALAGNASQSTSGCRVARGGGARRPHISFAAGGGAVGDAFVVEGTTNVKFSRELMVPGSTEPLIILGTDPSVSDRPVILHHFYETVSMSCMHVLESYTTPSFNTKIIAESNGSSYREKFFVKVYAAAFYVDYSIGVDTEKWREKLGIETFDASTVFNSIFEAPVVKCLSITLVRDVDGKTFVKALDDIIARRIKKPTVEEESSLSTFRNIFLERNLKQGTSIYLTWLEPSVMLILVLTNQSACQVDAEIKSSSVNYALYDGFFGSSPVSPTLRSSTVQLLEAIFAK